VNSNNQRARHALGWLEQQPEFLDAARKAERLLQLQSDLRESAQGLELTALGIEGEDLLVGTSGAGTAAKLRQLAPSITRALQSRGWQVMRIRFRPQPSAHSNGPSRYRPKTPVPDLALEQLQLLSESTSGESLKRAITHFIQTQRRQRR
jgi:hypothetical protein